MSPNGGGNGGTVRTVAVLHQVALLVLLLCLHDCRALPAWGTFAPVTPSIDENSASGTSVVTIVASGTAVTYAITSATGSDSGNKLSAFTINPSSGVVTVASPTLLDREAISYVDLVVTATDSVPSSITTTVRVGLNDVNEFAPVFTPASGLYTANVIETATVGTLVQVITVTDNDQSATSVICTISSGDTHSKFQMRADGRTIELMNQIMPDPPTSNPLVYTLVMHCRDNTAGVSLTSTGTVTVSVTPVNNFTPSWGTFTPTYPGATTPIASIDENTYSGTLFTATASDSDVGNDGVLVFSIASAKFSDGTTDITSLVTIGSSSGIVSLTGVSSPAINRESYTHMDFVLLVRDSSTVAADRRTATQSVRVGIKDVNEFDPSFSPASPYSVSLSETSPAGTVVKSVPVTDPDISNTSITCTIFSGNTPDRFQVRADGTTIELKSLIEPDKPTLDPVNYVLVINCADNTAGTYTGGQKTSTGTVSVSILYNNDYSPVWGTFSPAWSSPTTPITTVVENIAVGQTVFTAQATDLDTGVDGVVFYSIFSILTTNGTSVLGVFAISSSSGAVTVATSGVLDREKFGYVDVVINARDSPLSGTTFTITQTVRVAISDYNEFYPVFTPNSGLYYPTPLETATVGTAVQSVTVIDPDYSNTNVLCAIANGNSMGKFTVNSADKKLIETAAVIQPDKPTLDPTIYMLTVACADMNNGTVGTPILTSTAYVTVNVTLVNDYDPTITLNATTMVIPEDTPVSSMIVSVTADDLDYGNDGVFTITLIPSTPFALTGDRTKLLLTLALDRETVPSYTIQMVALDQGSPARSTTTTLTVTVTDVNDNTPVCTPSFYNTSVSSNTAATLLASITCTDADLGVNSLLVYSVVSGDTRNLTLSSTNGALTTTFLTYEPSAPTKTLLIAVRDSASPASTQRTTTVTVSVHVLPRNLGPPAWATFNPAWTSATVAIANLSERADAGFAVFTAVAVDGDPGPDGEVIYSLVSVMASDGSTDLSSVFNITSSTGEVKVKTYGVLDREAASAYTYVNFVVQARDNPTSGTPNSITRTVRVDITDFNELDPKFTGDPYSASFVEDTAIGTLVKQIVVNDPDISNTIIVCQITTGNDLSLFRTNSANSTIIELNKAIDPDKPNNHPLSYFLIVTCKDNNGLGSFRTATANLTVAITTTNDHTPSVSLPAGSNITIPETQATGRIADIIAVDQDYGSDGTITCSIAPTGTFG